MSHHTKTPLVNEIGVVYRNVPRADAGLVKKLSAFGAATVHEALGRSGLLKPYMRPIYTGAKACGNIVTVLLQPGDNWMMHVVAEELREGDIIVAGITSESSGGYCGDLLATSFMARGAQALIVDAGIRDVAEITRMGFPIWSREICAAGTVKATIGSVNIPVVCAGILVNPGDVAVADDDGVVIVPQSMLAQTVEAAERREANEAEKREILASGTLGLDMYKMREPLQKAGLRYIEI
jgi:4-hydroxy-4-methyl-2-oxoglutarate aldolase